MNQLATRRLTFLLSGLHRSDFPPEKRVGIANGICAHIKIDGVHKNQNR